MEWNAPNRIQRRSCGDCSSGQFPDSGRAYCELGCWTAHSSGSVSADAMPVIVNPVLGEFCSSILAYFSQHWLMPPLFLAVLVATLVSYSLNKVALPKVDQDVADQAIFGGDKRSVPVYAHRGGSNDAPENTLAAFREAKRNNASGVEFDLSFTRDNVAVLFHDDTVNRTTDGHGVLASISYEDVRQLDASSKHPFAAKYRGERVPTLEEGIRECLTLGMRMIIDVKEYDHRAVTVVDDMFKKFPILYRRALVASFYPQFIYSLRRRNPDVVTALTWRPGYFAYQDEERKRPRYKSHWKHLKALAVDWLLERALHGGLPYIIGVSGVLISKYKLSPEYVHNWRRQNLHVLAWTPNHPAEKNYLVKVLKVPIITDTLL